MSQRTTPPFRADHVGSLLRPPELLAGPRASAPQGRIAPSELREVEDSAIRDVVALQEDVGLQSATDGEFRRTSWHMDFIYQLGGVTRTDEQLQVASSATTEGTTSTSPPPRCGSNDRVTPRRDDLRRRLRASCKSTVTTAVPEADDPLAEHGALPRRRAPPSTPRSTPTSSSSGTTSRRVRRGDPRASASSAAPTSSSTTPPRLPERPRAARR